MTTAERKEVKRARMLVLAGNRTEAAQVLRQLETVPQRSPIAEGGQLILAFVTFRCDALKADDVPVHVCVTRQKVTEIQRTQQGTRGQGTEYPLCDTRSCAQGRAIREALGPNVKIAWNGGGFGGRFQRERPPREIIAQLAARDRLASAGLLRDIPTVDGCPVAVESEG